MRSVLRCCLIALFGMGALARADSITVANPSFESPTIGDGQNVSGVPDNWREGSTGNRYFNPSGDGSTEFTGGVSLGSQVYEAYNGSDIYQMVPVSVRAGTKYTLQFKAASGLVTHSSTYDVWWAGLFVVPNDTPSSLVRYVMDLRFEKGEWIMAADYGTWLEKSISFTALPEDNGKNIVLDLGTYTTKLCFFDDIRFVSDSNWIVAGTPAVTEGGASTTYTVRPAFAPSDSVTITPTTDGQATVVPSALTFTMGNWSTPQTVTVTAVNDTVAEGDHVSNIIYQGASADLNFNNKYLGVLVNITDNDAGIIFDDPCSVYYESVQRRWLTVLTKTTTTPQIYRVKLTIAPTQNVTVTITTDGQTTVNNGSGGNTLTFTTSNWNSYQNVSVLPVSSYPCDLYIQPALIHHVAASADGRYSGVHNDFTVYVKDVACPCGQIGTVYLESDLNYDCNVNFKDFAVIGSQWLQCTEPNVSGCTQ
jgi:hypothetical protein